MSISYGNVRESKERKSELNGFREAVLIINLLD